VFPDCGETARAEQRMPLVKCGDTILISYVIARTVMPLVIRRTLALPLCTAGKCGDTILISYVIAQSCLTPPCEPSLYLSAQLENAGTPYSFPT